jgi:hypothetical protein
MNPSVDMANDEFKSQSEDMSVLTERQDGEGTLAASV